MSCFVGIMSRYMSCKKKYYLFANLYCQFMGYVSNICILVNSTVVLAVEGETCKFRSPSLLFRKYSKIFLILIPASC